MSAPDLRDWHRFYDEGVPSSIDYPERTLGDLLAPTFRDDPRRTGVRGALQQ